MDKIKIIVLFVLFINKFSFDAICQGNKPILVIHGGAGNIIKSGISDSMELVYRKEMEKTLNKGYELLLNGKTSIEVVAEVVSILENSGIFNAGKGATINKEGEIELDASIMDGKTLKAGAVAGLKNIKNPILVAKAVMDSTKHVLLTGDGANKFAKKCGFEVVNDNYYNNFKSRKKFEDKKGTVGAVALDVYGNLAAATSTGGTYLKMSGRIGDSPIIGAGTYANNETCAVSCTGTGEYFIRTVAAYTVSALMEFKNLSLEEACKDVIFNRIASIGGDGGLIAVDKNGQIAMIFNTLGMFRGYIKEEEQPKVFLFKEN